MRSVSLESFVVALAVAFSLLPAILRSSYLTLLLVVFGGLIVFQSSSDINPQKLVFLTLFVLILVKVRGADHPLVRRSAVTGVVLALLTFASIAQGNSATAVLRDASNYFFLLAAAPLALYFGLRLPESTIHRILIAASALSLYAFVAEWTGRRGLAELYRFSLPSGLLIAVFVSAAAANASLTSRSVHRIVWWILAGVGVSIALMTGTRTNFLLLVCPIAIVVWSMYRPTGEGRRRTQGAIVSGLVVIPIGLALGVAIASALSVDVGAAWSRLATVVNQDQRGATDSLQQRAAQNGAAWSAFASQPLIGVGPGYVFEWASYGLTVAKFTIDSSLAVLAKWGLIGTSALLSTLFMWFRFLRPNRLDPTRWDLIFVGTWPFFVLSGFLATSIEDRGLPLAMILIGSGSLAARRQTLAGGEPARQRTPPRAAVGDPPELPGGEATRTVGGPERSRPSRRGAVPIVGLASRVGDQHGRVRN